MTFTPLETLLVGLVFSVLTALVSKLWFNQRFVTKEDFKAQADYWSNLREEQSDMLETQKRDLKLIFAMLREVIIRLPDLTPDQRAKILNMKVTE